MCIPFQMAIGGQILTTMPVDLEAIWVDLRLYINRLALQGGGLCIWLHLCQHAPEPQLQFRLDFATIMFPVTTILLPTGLTCTHILSFCMFLPLTKCASTLACCTKCNQVCDPICPIWLKTQNSLSSFTSTICFHQGLHTFLAKPFVTSTAKHSQTSRNQPPNAFNTSTISLPNPPLWTVHCQAPVLLNFMRNTSFPPKLLLPSKEPVVYPARKMLPDESTCHGLCTWQTRPRDALADTWSIGLTTNDHGQVVARTPSTKYFYRITSLF